MWVEGRMSRLSLVGVAVIDGKRSSKYGPHDGFFLTWEWMKIASS